MTYITAIYSRKIREAIRVVHRPIISRSTRRFIALDCSRLAASARYSQLEAAMTQLPARPRVPIESVLPSIFTRTPNSGLNPLSSRYQIVTRKSLRGNTTGLTIDDSLLSRKPEEAIPELPPDLRTTYYRSYKPENHRRSPAIYIEPCGERPDSLQALKKSLPVCPRWMIGRRLSLGRASLRQ